MANIFEKFKNIASTKSPAEVEVEEVDENATEREEAESEVEPDDDVEVAEVEEIEDEPAGVKGGKPSAPLATPAQTESKKDPFVECITAYLEQRAKEDAQFSTKYPHAEKTVKGCCEYIKNEARKRAINGCGVLTDPEGYGMAVHYFDEDSIKEFSGKVAANVISPKNNKSEDATPKKAEQKPANKASKKAEPKAKPTQQPAPVEKKIQKNIFDYAVEEGVSLFD